MQQCGNTEKAPAGADTTVAVEKWKKGSCGSSRSYGRVEIQTRLLREQTLLRQCENTEKACAGWENRERAPTGAVTTAPVWKYREAPVGVDTTVAVWKYREGFYAWQWGKQKRLLWVQMLLRLCGNLEKAPGGVGTAAAVRKYREGSCGCGHCCGSVGVRARLLREPGDAGLG
ncbi:hypothetical protein ROHU_013591 [Labeo rohita]|uniref:Uncharacterized protein n=1 Tax=Labeo rohita TaxID=84645 RepID=A0A498L3G3_LABRO|nr:hypothetical protein ROHU_013591 [Labeo rohita]